MNDRLYSNGGKHLAKKHNSRPSSFSGCKKLITLCALVVLILGAIGGTVAFLTTDSDEVQNTFTPGKVSCEIEEEFYGNEKKNVTVTNTGNTDAFIRAAVVITWQDEKGNVYSQPPVEKTDYDIKYGEEWTKHSDGYWYYNSAVSQNNSTTNLINSCVRKENKTVGDITYTLHVEIMADAIQSTPDEAVTEAWGVTVENGEIVNKGAEA